MNENPREHITEILSSDADARDEYEEFCDFVDEENGDPVGMDEWPDFDDVNLPLPGDPELGDLSDDDYDMGDDWGGTYYDEECDDEF